MILLQTVENSREKVEIYFRFFNGFETFQFILNSKLNHFIKYQNNEAFVANNVICLNKKTKIHL